MVSRYFYGLFFIGMVASVSGCSLISKVWNESAPERKTVKLEGEPLPSFNLVLNGHEEESIETLSRWRKSTLDSFSQIEGQRKDFLTEAINLSK